ncbi:MAG: hypothetical protein WC389_19575 [Lutibacter sp.]|jgi:hypothetical protein
MTTITNKRNGKPVKVDITGITENYPDMQSACKGISEKIDKKVDYQYYNRKLNQCKDGVLIINTDKFGQIKIERVKK